MLSLVQAETYDGITPAVDLERELPSDRKLSKDTVTELLILTFICIFGTIGNSIVVAVYSQKKHREVSASLYMLNLAIVIFKYTLKRTSSLFLTADLLTIIVVVGVHLSEYFPQTWPVLWRSDGQCALHRFGRFLTNAVTVYIMIAISVDRYIAMVRPFAYKTECTPKRTKYVLVAIWLLCALLSVPAAIKFKTKFTLLDSFPDSSGDACFLDQSVPIWLRASLRLYLSFAFTLIPAMITGLVYTVLVLHVWRHNRKFSATIRSSKESSSLNQWKIAKVLLAVYLGFMFCYVPYLIFHFSISFHFDVPNVFANISILLPYANSCVNPIIYMLWSESFRCNLLSLFCPHKNGTNTSRSERTSVRAIA
ncbi:Somatostatin receptor type 4 [Holothuria leucospilota]|uniref:Somatostatin receptor type 4 n=1 Tax=Holothuria leucospilota TaxID=206669 RepID=A0A9Q0YKX3_HOLLE|nr:Somatostatin receptor type 4 [Holothuria leucospilota]